MLPLAALLLRGHTEKKTSNDADSANVSEGGVVVHIVHVFLCGNASMLSQIHTDTHTSERGGGGEGGGIGFFIQLGTVDNLIRQK